MAEGAIDHARRGRKSDAAVRLATGFGQDGSRGMTTTAMPIDDQLLARSRDYCRDLTRSAAKNFYFGLKLLPEPRRSAMFALYAYMRLVDDIADDDRSAEQRSQDLEAWRQQTQAVLAGHLPDDRAQPMWLSFHETVHPYHIPPQVFDAIIEGQQQDLRGAPIETFHDLEQYCYRVAGVVGLASIYVWGFEGGDATAQLALHRGTAFQLTNVLRDLREDAARGRTYLPRQELAAYGLTERELSGANPSPR